jgi:hypothetical protein
MNVHVDIAANQAANASRYLAIEDPVRNATHLADALDRVVWHHRDNGERLPLDIYREIDAVLYALRSELSKAFETYEVA